MPSESPEEKELKGKVELYKDLAHIRCRLFKANANTIAGLSTRAYVFSDPPEAYHISPHVGLIPYERECVEASKLYEEHRIALFNMQHPAPKGFS